MSSEKKLYAVESIVTFFEVHLVEAENEEQAKKIAEHSDYNASKHVGTNCVNVYKFKDKDMKRFKNLENYFFDGYAFVDNQSNLCYNKLDGTFNGNMTVTKVNL